MHFITYVWTKPYLQMTPLDHVWVAIQLIIVIGILWLLFYQIFLRR